MSSMQIVHGHWALIAQLSYCEDAGLAPLCKVKTHLPAHEKREHLYIP